MDGGEEMTRTEGPIEIPCYYIHGVDPTGWCRKHWCYHDINYTTYSDILDRLKKAEDNIKRLEGLLEGK